MFDDDAAAAAAAAALTLTPLTKSFSILVMSSSPEGKEVRGMGVEPELVENESAKSSLSPRPPQTTATTTTTTTTPAIYLPITTDHFNVSGLNMRHGPTGGAPPVR